MKSNLHEFYTHAAQSRIRDCILKSFIQILIFVSWSNGPSGRWNGTGAPWCPICGATGAASLRETIYHQSFYAEFEKCCTAVYVKFTGCFLVISQSFLVCTQSTSLPRTSCGQAWEIAWHSEKTWNVIGLGEFCREIPS